MSAYSANEKTKSENNLINLNADSWEIWHIKNNASDTQQAKNEVQKYKNIDIKSISAQYAQSITSISKGKKEKYNRKIDKILKGINVFVGIIATLSGLGYGVLTYICSDSICLYEYLCVLFGVLSFFLIQISCCNKVPNTVRIILLFVLLIMTGYSIYYLFQSGSFFYGVICEM